MLGIYPEDCLLLTVNFLYFDASKLAFEQQALADIASLPQRQAVVSVFVALAACCRRHFRDTDNSRFFCVQHDVDYMVDIAVQLFF